jgi:hypothetical protein
MDTIPEIIKELRKAEKQGRLGHNLVKNNDGRIDDDPMIFSFSELDEELDNMWFNICRFL